MRESGHSGSARCQMQKLSSVGKFHDVPCFLENSRVNGWGADSSPNKIEMLQFVDYLPAVGTHAAVKKEGPSARPTGNSTKTLHCFPACAKGRPYDLGCDGVDRTMRDVLEPPTIHGRAR